MSAAVAGTWKLGDQEVNLIGYGAMRLTGNGMAGNSDGLPIDRDFGARLLRRAVDQGVNHIDTASFCCSPLRSANELINRALSSYRDDVVIVTMRRVTEHFGALTELREAGLVRHLGLSDVLPEHVVDARAMPRWSACRTSTGATRAELTKPVWWTSAVSWALLSSPSSRSPECIAGRRQGRSGTTGFARSPTPAPPRRTQVRLARTLHRRPYVLAIRGTADPAHLNGNIAAAALRLTP